MTRSTDDAPAPPPRRMPTLTEHNRGKDCAEAFIESARRNAGVACPKCGVQMKYTAPGKDRNVRCPWCRHTGVMR